MAQSTALTIARHLASVQRKRTRYHDRGMSAKCQEETPALQQRRSQTLLRKHLGFMSRSGGQRQPPLRSGCTSGDGSGGPRVALGGTAADRRSWVHTLIMGIRERALGLILGVDANCARGADRGATIPPITLNFHTPAYLTISDTCIVRAITCAITLPTLTPTPRPLAPAQASLFLVSLGKPSVSNAEAPRGPFITLQTWHHNRANQRRSVRPNSIRPRKRRCQCHQHRNR